MSTSKCQKLLAKCENQQHQETPAKCYPKQLHMNMPEKAQKQTILHSLLVPGMELTGFGLVQTEQS